jgi:hypothetical protein
MLSVFWLLLFLLGASLLALLPVLWGSELYNRYRGIRAVSCPENQQQVAVRFDALHAAASGMSGRPKLRLSDCTRWPERGDCNQACVPDALRALPYTRGEVAAPRTKKIYHLPVLMAAFLAWVLGVVLHSQHLFRQRWGASLGLGGTEIRQMTTWWSAHLLSVAMPLLFAYGVAWLLTRSKQKGVMRGIVIAIGLWSAVALASLAGTRWAGISADLLKMEAAYTFLSSVVIGAIIGGLSGKLVEQAFEKSEH